MKSSISPSSGPGKKSLNIVDTILSGQLKDSATSYQKKILFEFKPFMEGYYRFKEFLGQSMDVNLIVTSTIDTSIGSAVYRRKDKQIKSDEFEKLVYKGIDLIKTKMPKQNINAKLE